MSEDKTAVTLTIRLIRSFQHRNIKHVVYKDVNLSRTVADFVQFVLQDLPSHTGIPPPFKKYDYDTMKIEHKAHGAKTSDPVINREGDDKLLLKPERTLQESGVENETELSFFKMEDYLKYKENPQTTWE